jgi:hypothetical protein
MSQRCTFRLPDTLFEFLQIEAEVRQCGISDLIREGLERLLGLVPDPGAEPPQTPGPDTLVTPTPHDCTETVLSRLPMDVREGIEERARVLNLPVSKVVTALLIAKLPPSQPAPQVSGTVRPETAFVRWQALRQQVQQSAEAARADAALPPTAPPPGASALITGTST